MTFYRELTLKNGKTCILRNAAEEDAAEVFDVFCRVHGETDYLLTYPDESGSAEGEAAFLRMRTESARDIELCAVIDGNIVGLAGISGIGDRDKIRHRAEFGISILKEYWNLGIGRAMTQACIACAKDAGYAQLELEVVAENQTALALYESVGFSEYGRNPRGFLSRYSGWQELVLMRMEM